MMTALRDVVITLALVTFAYEASAQSCTTPLGRSGNCVVISSCRTLLNLAQDRYRSPSDTRLIKDSRCGIEGNVQKVCCESGVSAEPPTVTPATATRVKNYDVNDLLPKSDECGKGVDTDKIVGGTEASLGEYPWIGLMVFKRGRSTGYGCGASLISKRYAITAAHCVAGRILTALGTPYALRLGDHDRTNSGRDCEQVIGGMKCTDEPVEILLEKYIAHPGFRDVAGPKNDIAILRLSSDAPYTDYIRPICLPTNDDTLSLKTGQLRLTTAGWGLTEANVSSSVKLFVVLPYVELNQCQLAHNTYPGKQFNASMWDKQICAGGAPGKDSCKGDSGGPLMLKTRQVDSLIGVVSYGPFPCGEPNVPGVYTKTYPYLDWIKDQIEP